MGILLVSHADKHLSTTYAETDRRLKQTSSNKHNTMTQQTLLSIRQQLAQRGTHGFRSFVVALDKVDFNKIRSIDKEQWKSALASVGVKLSGPEIESVFFRIQHQRWNAVRYGARSDQGGAVIASGNH